LCIYPDSSPVARSISISPFRAAGSCRIRLSSSDGGFEFSSLVSTAAAICTGAKDGPTRSAVRACRRQVNTTLAATPLQRANLSHLRPWRQGLLDDPSLVILRPAPPPLQPAQNLDPHRLLTLKLDLSHTLREIPRVRQDGARRMLTTVIIELMDGQYSNPVRVVAFNTAEGWVA
jgi:hypothetical protein